jgi:beta-galactosidase
VEFLALVISEILTQRQHTTTPLPEGLRLRRRGDLCFTFNFGAEPRRFEPQEAEHLCGALMLAQGEYAVWKLPARG